MKKVRLYAPYVKVGRNWVRATQPDGTPRMAFRIEKARVIYQDWLLASALGGVSEERELRPVPSNTKVTSE